MIFGSLFTGIGGLDLALEAFGHTAAWQAENDRAARRVLAEKWPGVHCYRDVKEIDHGAPAVDIICGGSPCQDISVAGAGAGLDGSRSSLWYEFARILRALKPAIVFFENVPAIATRGLDRVLRDLAEGGYDAVWDCFTAGEAGSSQKRERLFVLAYANGDGRDARGKLSKGQPDTRSSGAHGDRVAVAHAHGRRRRSLGLAQLGGLVGARGHEPDRRGGARRLEHRFPPGPARISEWDGPQPAVRRSAARVPVGMDGGWRAKNRLSARLRLLGNAAVWQQAALALEVLAGRALQELAA